MFALLNNVIDKYTNRRNIQRDTTTYRLIYMYIQYTYIVGKYKIFLYEL
jgi:hypothetical protein